MIYQALFDFVMDRKFVTVDAKSGNVVQKGFIYEYGPWMAGIEVAADGSVALDEFDAMVDRFLDERPARYFSVDYSSGETIELMEVHLAISSFAAGWTKAKGRSAMQTTLGKRVVLK